MVPTLKIGDVLLVNEFEYRMHKPRQGEIVVFKPPIDSTNDFIKRIIAVPGDTLRIDNGNVYVNGVALKEPYIAEKTAYRLRIRNYGIYVDDGDGVERALDPASADIPPRSMWQAPDRVPSGFYFLMGDNRNHSDDSHIWGFAQTDGHFAAGPLAKTDAEAHFAGRAFLLFWPLDHLHILP